MMLFPYINLLKIRIREITNPYLGPIRRKLGGINESFSIISNNCWAGHVYRFFNLPYLTPTIGLYFFSEDYIKFLENLRYYIVECELWVSDINSSKYKNILLKRGGKNSTCPIGHLDDIEIIFLHYDTQEEAQEKWNRRKCRIVWNNIIVKNSEQNLSTLELLQDFDKLPYTKKFVFTSKDYSLESQVIFKESCGEDEVFDDTTHFRKYVDLYKLITTKEKFS